MTQNQLNGLNNLPDGRHYKKSDEDAAIALPFYLKGAAKMFYEGLPEPQQNNLEGCLRLVEARFEGHSDEELLMAQTSSESALDFLDRVILKASEENIPDHVIIKIAKKGFHRGLIPYVIQKDPKTMDDLKSAAKLAEKCLEAKLLTEPAPQVNAVRDNNCMKDMLAAMENLNRKMDELNRDNVRLRQQVNQSQNRQNFSNFQAKPQNYQNRAANQQYRKPTQFSNSNFGNNVGNVRCGACGIPRCSGNRDRCFARFKTCFKCNEVGHLATKCPTARDANREIIRQ